MSTIVSFLGTLFGIKQGATLLNTGAGVLNWGALAAAGAYVIQHSDQPVPLGSVSLGALGIAGLLLFLVFEVVRRHSPGAGDQS